ncbi:MAG: hypothetical protein CSA07_00630 [Bacteroidia bacterium]|nr:MAG: hypothetical protein CSA07_00630 [Bacteroidia bacterium]
MRFVRFPIFLFILLFTFLSASAQSTRVRGKIVDADTGEPLAFIGVTVKGKPIGTITDDQGIYFLETRTSFDTLVFSYIGYQSQQRRVQPGKFQYVNISLKAENIQVEEVVVRRERSPALRVLDSVIAHKARNDPRGIDRYRCRVYNKLQVDLNNIDSSTFDLAPFRSLAFLRQQLDTNAATGKVYLPAFMSEAVSTDYYQRDPRKVREVIEASRLSGVENDGFDQFMGGLYQDINLYDNFINIFDKGLVSPINSSGPLYYRYFLVDSSVRHGVKHYQISFKPRRRGEPTFKGYIWVDTVHYALVEAKMELTDANLNFVNYLLLTEESVLVDDSVYFPRRKQFFMDVTVDRFLGDYTMGLFGRKTVLYDSVKLGEPMPRAIARNPNEVILRKQIDTDDSAAWNRLRPVELSRQEKQIYRMVDTVKSLPFYTAARTLVRTFALGYIPLKYVEIGRIYNFYSHNPIEGHRALFGLRTTRELWEPVRLSGYAAYGFKDRDWKWMGQLEWVQSRYPWRKFTLRAKYDMVTLGEDPDRLSQNNILGTILRRKWNYMYTPVRSYSLDYYHEVYSGLSMEAGLGFHTIYATPYVTFNEPDGTAHRVFEYPEIEFGIRWKHKEKFITNRYERRAASSKYPALSLRLTGAPGLGRFFTYPYLKAEGQFDWKVPFNPIGFSRFILTGGYVLGDVPYPLLKLHEGSETYGLSRYGWNMMGYYELASDRWASLVWEHHFNGLLFNHVPLLRELQIREVVAGKILTGDVRPANLQRFTPPASLEGIGRIPYIELSAGVENILHLIRIDAVWRLTHNGPNRSFPLGLRAGIYFQL